MQTTDNISTMTKRIVKIVAVTLCVLLLLACLSVLIFVYSLKKSEDFVRFDKNKLNEVCSTVAVLDCNGEPIKEAMYIDSKKQIPLAALHDYTYMAFVAVEDKRFFKHSGIDVKRVLGAAAKNVKSDSFKEGASTISQQLIKNTHLNNDKNLKRKVNEMLLALELENNYTKEEILEMYLNTIYFGRNAYGIENAANVYFGKSATELTISESATLAGMIKAPNVYAPDKNTGKCAQRRNTVLKLMLEQKIITEEQFDEAISAQIVYEPYKKTEETYMKRVLDEACRLLNMTQSQLFHSGFVIETFYDPAVQQVLNQKVAVDATQNADGSLADLSCLVCKNDGGVSACYFRGSTATARKQAGSTLKPIAVYTPALCEKLITQASPVLDEPTDFSGYKPANANGYNGWTTIKYAVTKSLNVPAVKTLNTLGLENAERYLNKLGFSGKQNLSLALGNIDGGLTIQELAKCYTALANNGVAQEVSYIKSISGSQGEVYSRKTAPSKVFEENAAYLMTDMLLSAVKTGTAKLIAQCGIPTAAKTGTVGNSNGNSEALVAGYTTEHTYVFWYSGTMPNSINGATAPCNLAAGVLAEMYKNRAPQRFSQPKGVAELAVDKECLYNRQLVKLTDDGERFLFDNANKPTEKVQTIRYNYQLSTEMRNGTVFLVLPQIEQGLHWEIFKKENGKDIEMNSTAVSDGYYFARLVKEGKCVYETNTVQVVTSNPKQNEDGKSFWDILMPLAH